MSLTVQPVAAPGAAAPPAARARSSGAGPAWARVALAVALLGASGGVRAWQARRVADHLRGGMESPFPLADLPLDLGRWKGRADQLDPQVARHTGSRDHILRTYVDERTGVRIGMIVLYGPPMEVIEHSPENCYPASGYTQVEGPQLRMVAAGGSRVPFYSLVFARGEGGQVDRQEVYYTWYYGGQWSPARAATKRIERIPGMYKVHLFRQVGDGELLDVSNPCESLLAALIPELDRRIAAAGRGRPSPPRAPAPTPG